MLFQLALPLLLQVPVSLQADPELVSVSVEFSTDPLWIVLDETRQRAVVSLPEEDRIAVVSTATYEIIDTHFVGQLPRGLAFSPDGSELYCALGASGSISVVDAETYEVQRTINASENLGDPRTWDVSSPLPGRLYVSSNPGSNGFAWIVEVDLENGDSQQRVASNRIIRASPEFLEDPNDRFLYVGAGFSPNSLYKLDLDLPQVPIVLEDDHGSVSGTSDMAITPDGAKIVLRGGQVVATDTFNQLGTIEGGPAAFVPGEDGSSVWRIGGMDSFERIDLETYEEIEDLPNDCGFSGSFFTAANAFVVRTAGLGYLGLVQNRLCGQAVLGPPFVLVDSLSPARADYTESVPVVVSGSFFDLAPISEVRLGDELLGFQVTSPGSLEVTVPAGDPGPQDLVVVNASGATVLEDAFERTPSLRSSAEALEPGEPLELDLALTPFAPVLLFYGEAGPSLTCPPLGGLLTVDVATIRPLAQLLWFFDTLGIDVPTPAEPALVGLELRVQALVGDLDVLEGAFSNAVDLRFE